MEDSIQNYKLNDSLIMDQSFKTIPVSIEFPSFAPSPQASPAKIEQHPNCTFESRQIHRISIHLPEQYTENSSQSTETPLSFQNTNTTLCDSTTHHCSNVRVYCRMRPANKSNVQCLRHDETMVDDGENCYSFDHIFGREASQGEVYDQISKRHIEDFFLGKNSTIFAYGQTGSGKTHTMFGKMDNRKNFGIIPRTLEQIFKRDLQGSQILCSMLEIYNEKLVDLFNHITNSHVDLKLKQSNDGVYLEGLQEISVENQNQLLNLIREGHRGRKVAATMTNDVSSRSHTILFVYRKFHCRGQAFRNKLCFIDLAGSEKIRKSGVKGQTLEETKKINLSLSCLGNVVHALTNGSEYIPYRNSKLTRILKDSLSTDTCTSIITTCSLDKSDYSETLSTIKFAVRAKKIKNKKKLEQEEQPSLQEEFMKLKKQLQATKKQLAEYKQKEVQADNAIKQGDIPEERSEVHHKIIPSISVLSHGISSRMKLVSSQSSV